MSTQTIRPRKALNKAYLKAKPLRDDIDTFKQNFTRLLNHTNDQESEEFHKNLVADFLKNTWYAPDYFINTKGRNDQVIHNDKDAKSGVGVIIEAKKPTNKAEMLQTDRFNVKAMQELVLYYLRERITNNNLAVKHLIATNIQEWFIFDALDFEKYFARDKTLLINNLNTELPIPISSATVLKDTRGRRIKGEKNTLEYLFAFLDAYDFSSEGSEDIQESNKTLINASVLGLIFEKINGYKEGSFFTPGFITMYMCRETIRRAVLQKFKEAKGWDCSDLDALYDKIEEAPGPSEQ